MNDNLLARLRSRSATQPQNFGLDDEAADRIEAQAARIAECELALRKAVVALAGACVHAPDLEMADVYEAVSAALAPKENSK